MLFSSLLKLSRVAPWLRIAQTHDSMTVKVSKAEPCEPCSNVSDVVAGNLNCPSGPNTYWVLFWILWIWKI